MALKRTRPCSPVDSCGRSASTPTSATPSRWKGFVCPQSSADVLMTMARYVSETRQGAFTWTGPYGSGKSSLAIALSALLSGNTGLQKDGTKVFGQKLTKTVWNALPTGTKRMACRPGRRETWTILSMSSENPS